MQEKKQDEKLQSSNSKDEDPDEKTLTLAKKESQPVQRQPVQRRCCSYNSCKNRSEFFVQKSFRIFRGVHNTTIRTKLTLKQATRPFP